VQIKGLANAAPVLGAPGPALRSARAQLHLPGIPMEAAALLAAQMKRPEGTVRLGSASFPGLHDPSATGGTLMEVVAGAHVFRVVREGSPLSLQAYHSSPGGGTRVASVALSAFEPSETLDIWLAWAPETLRLTVADPARPESLVRSDGVESPRKLWVDRQGQVIVVGHEQVAVMGARVFSQGAELVAPPARDLWPEVLQAVRILLAAESSEGYIFEVAAANAALGMLTTGFETYTETRFAELADEGIPPNLAPLVMEFGTREERDQLEAGETPALLSDHPTDDPSAPLHRVMQRINFQNYKACKRAYNKGYAIRFGHDLEVSSQLLERVQRLLRYRHRVVHVSPLIAFLNQPEAPPEEPEFSNRTFVESARATFDEFIAALHASSLRLRPPELSAE
jgi:hypothetical protein